MGERKLKQKMKNKETMSFNLFMGILLLILFVLTACSASTEIFRSVEIDETRTEDVVLTEDENTQDDDVILKEGTDPIQIKNVSEKETENDDCNRKSILAVYQQTLTQLYEEQIFPDGAEAEYYSDYSDDISENQFAVYDVDLDGRDELIILYTTCSMAGMTARIYDYDEATDSLYLELSLFPSLRFYDNAVIEEDASHSQGYAGAFWPYTYYVYDDENDTYQATVCTDAWDRSLAEVDYQGNVFPAEADEDGDGMVYYVCPFGEINYGDPIDWDAYEIWHTSAVGNEIKVPYKYLTPENIAIVQ